MSPVKLPLIHQWNHPLSNVLDVPTALTDDARIMRQLKFILPVLAMACLVACATFEGNAYKTISTISTTVEAARKSWVLYVTQQRTLLANNPVETQKLEVQVAKVGVIYAEYQTAMRAANDVISAYRAGKDTQGSVTLVINALSSASGNIIALISQLTATPPK